MGSDSVSLLTPQFNTHLKILVKSFNRKFSRFISILAAHKTSGSLGALVGFIIAFLFARKFLRSPIRLWKRQKHINSESTGEATLTLDDKEIKSGDGLYTTEKVPLAQLVRKKLCGGRKMTCQLLGVVLEESTPEELQEHVTVRSSAVEVLLEIGKVCDVYLMETILDDDSEENVLSALEKSGLLGPGGLMKEKVLFCSTGNGRSSFVRQLEPDWHIDKDPDILSPLSRFVKNVLLVAPTGSSYSSRSSIFTSTSLEAYFTNEGV
ncbi:peroxisome biogenesis protein 22-like [Apium graveolens]|uniref:peroxisome biogenesis protein 22-like n=1 Tax=Apium graveolens TaxID=4045 RepID=UPI003D79687E